MNEGCANKVGVARFVGVYTIHLTSSQHDDMNMISACGRSSQQTDREVGVAACRKNAIS